MPLADLNSVTRLPSMLPIAASATSVSLMSEAVQLGQSAGANLLQWIGRGLAKKLG